jgi:hypothetical protein
MMFLELALYWIVGAVGAAIFVYCASVVSGNADAPDRDLP